MTAVREIFAEFGPEYIERFGSRMPREHIKVIEAMLKCRTPAMGMTVYECTACGEIHQVFRSCGNRHCPNCQHQKTLEWMDRQAERQMPGHHFMATFTVPEEIRVFIRSHQRAAYSAMFKASSETLKLLSLNEKHMGGDVPGFFGVLHTWGRQLQYHPHIHYLAVGGAFSTADGTWHPSSENFFLPIHALSRIFRGKFRDLMKRDGLYPQINPAVWKKDWNVNVQPVGTAEQTVKYLAPYVFKVAVSDHRIEKIEGRIVTVLYRKPRSSRTRRLHLDATEFIRRFLQHVLPSGFMKVRYYGFMNPNSAVPAERIRGLIELSNAFEIQTPEPEIRKPEPLYCPACGGELKYLCSVLPFQMAPQKTSVEAVFEKTVPKSA